MKISPNVWHIICVIVAGASVSFTALNAVPQFHAMAWIAAAATMLAIGKSVFTDTPKVTAAKAEARARGALSVYLPLDPPPETKVPS